MVPQRIVAIGASSVYGRVDPSGGGFVGRLRRWHESNGRHNAVFNLGIGGDTTTGMRDRLVPEASLRRPDLLLFHLGHNDARRTGALSSPTETSLENYRRNLRELIRLGRGLADCVFVSTYPIDETKTQPLVETEYFLSMSDVGLFAEAGRKMCESEAVPYLNVYSELLSKDIHPLLYEDGLHCNSAGHQFIFEKLRDFLLALYNGGES